MDNPILNAMSSQPSSMDIPPALAGLLSMGSAPAQMPASGGGIQSGMGNQQGFAPPSYEAGGMIGAGGMPAPTGVGVNPQAQGGQPMDYQMLEMNINQFMSQHPQEVAQIRDTMMQLLQSGELTQQELNMVVQLATVAAQNPEMYPYVRQFAIQQGIAAEQDLPQDYQQGLVFVLLLAARSIQQDVGGQNMMQGGSPAMANSPVIPSMRAGGSIPQSKKDDGSVLINAHEGEYVIPKNVVEMKGKEFFDNLVEKYKGGNAK